MKRRRGETPKPKMIPRDRRKLVHIEWQDASGPGRTGWEYTDHVEDESGDYLCWSTGWIIGESRTHVFLAAHLGNIQSEIESNEQMCGRITIPRAMIRRQTTLKGLR